MVLPLVKGFPLKLAVWILTALFGALLFWTQGTASPGTHLTTRFLQDAQRETGMSPLAAVLADYRSFDLLILAFLGLGACLLCLLSALHRLPQVPLKGRSLLGLGAGLTGVSALLGLGAFTLISGSNWLDFEPFTHFTAPEKARSLGALYGSGAVLLCWVGALICFKTSPEASRGE